MPHTTLKDSVEVIEKEPFYSVSSHTLSQKCSHSAMDRLPLLIMPVLLMKSLRKRLRKKETGFQKVKSFAKTVSSAKERPQGRRKD